VRLRILLVQCNSAAERNDALNVFVTVPLRISYAPLPAGVDGSRDPSRGGFREVRDDSVESRFSGLGCEAILERGIDVWARG